jgi:hypothetical protein
MMTLTVITAKQYNYRNQIQKGPGAEFIKNDTEISIFSLVFHTNLNLFY